MNEKKEKVKYPFWKTMKVMQQNLIKVNKKIYLYCIIYTLGAAIAPIFPVLLPKLLINEITGGRPNAIRNIIWIGIMFFLLFTFFDGIKTFFANHVYPRLTFIRINFMRDMLKKLMSIDYKYMEDSGFNEEHEKALNATNGDGEGLEMVYRYLFLMPALIISSLVFIFMIGSVNILILLGMFLNIWAIAFVGKKKHQYLYEKKKEVSHRNRRTAYYQRTTADFSFGKDIRVYNFKDVVLDNYSKEIEGYKSIWKLIRKKQYKISFLGLFTLLLSDGLTYGILVYKVMNGMSIADFSMYIAAIASLTGILNEVVAKFSDIYSEAHYSHDFFEFMENKSFNSNTGDKKAATDGTLEVEFKNVSFKYPKTEKYILKNLNLKISKGEKLAIVGINGAGKTTIVKLIMGLFYPTEGEILINGIPTAEYGEGELYKMFAPVFQDINIMSFPLKNNISCDDNPEEDRVWTALDKAGLKEKAEDLEKGLDTMLLKIIDEKGVDFSGGERQKLAIARALYKGGRMVIMDEPTAALDALAEAEIYEEFGELIGGKTAIYISHRLASTKFCDNIAFFDSDGLAEYGSHKELMEKRGKYYDMFIIQGKYYKEGAKVIE